MKLQLAVIALLAVGVWGVTCQTKNLLQKRADSPIWVSGAGTLSPTNSVLDTATTNDLAFQHADVFIPNGFERTAFEFEAFAWPTNQLLLIMRCNGNDVVQITCGGEIIYDTNNVKRATQMFWDELSAIIREHYTALLKFDERVKESK